MSHYASGALERSVYGVGKDMISLPHKNCLCVACGHFLPQALVDRPEGGFVLGPNVTRVRTCPDCTVDYLQRTPEEKETALRHHIKLMLACEIAGKDVRG